MQNFNIEADEIIERYKRRAQKDKADFYSFVRQLDAMKATLKDGENTIVLDKDSPIAELFY